MEGWVLGAQEQMRPSHPKVPVFSEFLSEGLELVNL